jgi:TatA/E family protein of Tat protein translocase
MPFGIGHWELIVLGVVLALLFGGSQLPRIGRQLGLGAREARDTLAGIDPRTPLRELGEPTRAADEKSQAKQKDVSDHGTSTR